MHEKIKKEINKHQKTENAINDCFVVDAVIVIIITIGIKIMVIDDIYHHTCLHITFW